MRLLRNVQEEQQRAQPYHLVEHRWTSTTNEYCQSHSISCPAQGGPKKHIFATICQSKIAHQHEQTTPCKHDVMLDYELKVDPQLEDWHVITWNEGHGSFNPAIDQTNRLYARLATPICNGRARYLRCGHSELPDLTAWLIWQQHEPLIVIGEPSCILLDDVALEALSDQDISVCKSSIVGLFQTRSAEQIRLVLLAAYLVATSFRSFNKLELAAAVRDIAELHLTAETSLDRQSVSNYSDDELLDLCSPLLLNGPEDRVAFRVPSTKTFLENAGIPGFEHGHGTMTQMCFNQIRHLGAMFVVRPWIQFQTWFGSCTLWPLLRYVARYWWYHYKFAAPSRPDLSAGLIHMINIALAGQSPHETQSLLQRKVIDAGYGISQVYELPELAAIYRNMGASQFCGSGHPRSVPLPDWHDLRPVFGIKTPVDIDPETDVSVSDVFDRRSICYIDQEQSRSITSILKTLHLMSTSDMEDSGSCQGDAAMLLPDTEPDVVEDWEVLNFHDIDQASSSTFLENPDEWQDVVHDAVVTGLSCNLDSAELVSVSSHG